MSNKRILVTTLVLGIGISSCQQDRSDLEACAKVIKDGFRDIAEDRSKRFMGKVSADTARCRGGDKAVKYRPTPWVDWSNYWATEDASSKHDGEEAKTKLGQHLRPNGRGIDGALIDLEYQRIELIKFNLFDNHTYETYIKGLGDNDPGPSISQWEEMRLPESHPSYAQVGADGPQLCQGELVRYRTLTGICNDIRNPRMGSTGTEFSRNAQFESTFPRLAKNELVKARHSDPVNGNRLGLLKPDPQLISRKLFTRHQQTDSCRQGYGAPDYSAVANCDYKKAPFFNVLAAFWIQFMTHDWFSHLVEGRNSPGLISVGCESDEARGLGCRPGDRAEAVLFAREEDPGSFEHNGASYLKRSYKTTANQVTAWWDASQIYGYDSISQKRVLRDKTDRAKLMQPEGYLPRFSECAPYCPMQPQWVDQEATAFPDNWNIGLSFYHNLFVREHNTFVDRFRKQQQENPDQDSGLRNPVKPEQVITYKDAPDEIIYQAARLVVSALIAKIHTIEWTTQLLYDEPLFQGMNANWFGLFNLDESKVSQVLRNILNRDQNLLTRTASSLARMIGLGDGGDKANAWYSVLASGAGIFGLNNKRIEGLPFFKSDKWDVSNPEDVNGGVNHFGSPFNFPEEFTTVYRLHPLVPDLIEFREVEQPNEIKLKIPVVKTVRGEASDQMHSRGLENWGLSMGRQRLGLLLLQNHPLFLQNLDMKHLNSPTKKLDIVALDIIRDRERGVPRFNEFRRQIGLKSLSSFDDFVDQRLADHSADRRQQEKITRMLREIYGTHVCDASKIISVVQRDHRDDQDDEDDAANFINDCLGHPDKTVVDNIEDVDMVVGWLAEFTRPHGFAISETQFHVFIINASRRLFSDRFLTSSFRPEFYSQLGYDWVINNGPLDECPYLPLKTNAAGEEVCVEPQSSNGHEDLQVSPLKRVLIRNIPELRDELLHVVNAFDPWGRDRGKYYSLRWQARADAASDPAFDE